MITEVWKDIAGYEGKYQVSNLGRVKALERIDFIRNGVRRVYGERILKYDRRTKKGYIHIRLWSNGKAKSFIRSRVVLKAFNPNIDADTLVCDHINGDRADDRVVNLRWATQKANVANHQYARYLQSILDKHNIEYEQPDAWLQ